jgi:hypothetical protein
LYQNNTIATLESLRVTVKKMELYENNLVDVSENPIFTSKIPDNDMKIIWQLD